MSKKPTKVNIRKEVFFIFFFQPVRSFLVFLHYLLASFQTSILPLLNLFYLISKPNFS